MEMVFLEDNLLSIKTNNICTPRSVVEFSLTKNKKEIFVIEGCDHYLASNLDYYNVTKLINGLKQMRSKICNVEKALSLFKMYFEMKDKKMVKVI